MSFIGWGNSGGDRNYDDAISCLKDLQNQSNNDEQKRKIQQKINDINSCRKSN